jgi:hypothetical protein
MTLSRVPRRIGQVLIVIYQRTLSLDHGPLAKWYLYRVCKFHPTCSEFGHEAIGRFGLLKGSWMTLKRIFRCNPWSLGGNDPVPR